VRELLERAVEADGVLRVEVERGLDREHADQPEHDEACDVTDDAGARAPRRVAVPPLLLELLRDSAIEVPDTDAHDHEPADDDEQLAARPIEHRVGRFAGPLVLRPAAAGADEQLARGVRQPGIDDPAARVPGALGPLVGDEGLHEPPDRVRGEAEGERADEQLPPARAGDLLERAFAARGLAAVTERELQREGADDPEGDALRDEAGARERAVPAAFAARILLELHCRAVHPFDNARTAQMVTSACTRAQRRPPAASAVRPWR
jgi:hypothetical protein